jgi:hypothetical protein
MIQTPSCFGLQDRVKAQLQLSPSTHYRGYQRLGDNVTRHDTGFTRDWHEALDFFKEVPPGKVWVPGAGCCCICLTSSCYHCHTGRNHGSISPATHSQPPCQQRAAALLAAIYMLLCGWRVPYCVSADFCCRCPSSAPAPSTASTPGPSRCPAWLSPCRTMPKHASS